MEEEYVEFIMPLDLKHDGNVVNIPLKIKRENINKIIDEELTKVLEQFFSKNGIIDQKCREKISQVVIQQ